MKPLIYISFGQRHPHRKNTIENQSKHEQEIVETKLKRRVGNKHKEIKKSNIESQHVTRHHSLNQNKQATNGYFNIRTHPDITSKIQKIPSARMWFCRSVLWQLYGSGTQSQESL